MRNETYEIVHFEIPAKDPEKLRNFYAEVFGWKFKNSAAQDMQYWNISTGTKHIPGVTGGMYKRGSKNETLVNYISTPDLEETMAGIEKAGGRVVVDIKETKEHGRTAMAMDP